LDLKLFCGTGSVGASNFDDYAAFIRFAFRSGLEAAYTVSNLGFRLAQDAPTRSPSQNTQSNES
jgi:formylglycine-generating enzyme required for sulfatase activity